MPMRNVSCKFVKHLLCHLYHTILWIYTHQEKSAMLPNVIVVLLGWLAALAIFFGFLVLLRYLQHRERMALITHGMNPNMINKQHRNRGILRAGLITMMVGLSLTIGLYPVGFVLPATIAATPFHLGPWLLPGLIPF